MAKGGHGLFKEILGPTMPNLSTPCPASVPVAVFYPLGHPTQYAYALPPIEGNREDGRHESQSAHEAVDLHRQPSGTDGETQSRPGDTGRWVP
jgi:hypothetical protein